MTWYHVSVTLALSTGYHVPNTTPNTADTIGRKKRGKAMMNKYASMTIKAMGKIVSVSRGNLKLKPTAAHKFIIWGRAV